MECKNCPYRKEIKDGTWTCTWRYLTVNDYPPCQSELKRTKEQYGWDLLQL